MASVTADSPAPPAVAVVVLPDVVDAVDDVPDVVGRVRSARGSSVVARTSAAGVGVELAVLGRTGATGEVVGTAGRATVLGACASPPAVAVVAADGVTAVPALAFDAPDEAEDEAGLVDEPLAGAEPLPEGVCAASGVERINAMPRAPARLGSDFMMGPPLFSTTDHRPPGRFRVGSGQAADRQRLRRLMVSPITSEVPEEDGFALQ